MVTSYLCGSTVYLKIPGTFFIEPFGPIYPKAVAKVFRLIPVPPFAMGETDIVFVREVVVLSGKQFPRERMGGKNYPIRVSNDLQERGHRILEAVVDATLSRFSPLYVDMDGEHLRLILERQKR